MPGTKVVAPIQSLVDMAMQHMGDADMAVHMAMLNGISLTSALGAGERLAVLPADNVVLDYLTAMRISPATGVGNPGGIGYWIIGNDFIVQ